MNDLELVEHPIYVKKVSLFLDMYSNPYAKRKKMFLPFFKVV